MTVSEIS
jgi:hypothetical protein